MALLFVKQIRLIKNPNTKLIVLSFSLSVSNICLTLQQASGEIFKGVKFEIDNYIPFEKLKTSLSLTPLLERPFVSILF